MIHFLNWLKNRGSWRMIPCEDGEDYLERWLITRFKNSNTYIHRFWRSDPADVHNHPWWSVSLVLKGGYREYFADGTYIDRKAGDIILRDPNSFHRVELPEGAAPGSCWTLFFTFKRSGSWGFLTEKGWVPAGVYGERTVAVHGVDFVFEGKIFPKIKWLN